jgi:nucleoside-diphosphate-sugar epimerase
MNKREKILVTGAAGLVGSHLRSLLEEKNYDVYTVSSSIENEKSVKIDFSSDWDTEKLPSGIDCIIHLSQSRDFRDFPGKAKQVFYVNTLSTVKLIDWAWQKGIKKFIYASSAGVYGNSDQPFTEEHPLQYKKELGFYLGTKFCSEIILDNYSALLDVIQMRFIFVYGKGQDKSMLIPRLVDNIRNNRELTLQGNEGLRTNPVHVSDAVKAIHAAIDLKGSHKFNIGGAEVLSLRKIAETIGEACGIKPVFIQQPGTAGNIIGDISKMKTDLVMPEVSFAEGIKDFL